MRATLWWLGLIFGTLSVVMLVKRGFEVAFTSSLQSVLEFYDGSLTLLFGWVEQAARVCLTTAEGWLGVSLELSPAWKYVFILLLIVVSAVSRAAGDSMTAVRLTTAGVFAALVVSLFWGVMLPSDIPEESPLVALILSLSPTMVIVIIDFLSLGPGPNLIRVSIRTIAIILAGVTVFAIFYSVSSFVLEVRPTETVISNLYPLAAVLGYSIFLLLPQLFARPIGNGEAKAPRDSKAAEIAWNIVATFAGTAVFIATNAGLKLAGL